MASNPTCLHESFSLVTESHHRRGSSMSSSSTLSGDDDLMTVETAASILMSMSLHGTPNSTPNTTPSPEWSPSPLLLSPGPSTTLASITVSIPPASPPRPNTSSSDTVSSSAIRSTRNTRGRQATRHRPHSAPYSVDDEDLSGYTTDERRAILARPKRDRPKAKSIADFLRQPHKYYRVAQPCTRCAKSGWACMKLVPQTVNNKPGPARGHGRGCVSCHKSACSFVAE